MMTPEELLRPRYKVIADYPGNNMAVGKIIQFDWYLENQRIELCYYYNKYPHLFQPLQWWEDRKPEEMPEYVKYCDTSMYFPVDVVCRGSEAPFNAYEFTADRFLPATEKEYLEYIKQKEGR